MDSHISDERTRLEFIRKVLLSKDNNLSRHDVQIGIESIDDAALIKISLTESLVIASDFIRGTDFYLFELGYLNYHDIGYYLVVANISDIAAMGARPYYLTTIFRYSGDVTDEQFREVFRGMKDAANMFDIAIVGGDTGGYRSNVFAATAIGFIKTEQVLLRKNVQDDDLLCVTGVIGLPITALIYFKKAKISGYMFSKEEEERVLLSWRRPTARVQEGLLLSENKLAHACQDISDGLKATIEQLSQISGKTFSVHRNRLPIDETTQKLSHYLGIDAVRIAVSASVDFELLFTISPEKQEECKRLFLERGLHYTVIGEVNKLGKNVLLDQSGIPSDLPGISWKHQSGDYLSQILKP